RLRHHRIAVDDAGMAGELRETDRRSYGKAPRAGFEGAQLGNAVHVDEDRRGNRCAPPVGGWIGGSPQQPADPGGRPGPEHVGQRFGTQQLEFGERLHHAAPLRFLEPARRRFSMAAKTRSGVTGRSLKRSRVASAMALVSAGRNAASEPSPASLASNGPCGSLLSTMPTSIGGESWMVGTR